MLNCWTQFQVAARFASPAGQGMSRSLSLFCALIVATSSVPTARAQSVGLPAPRLLTTMPMGGNPGSQVEITISGENIDSGDELVFTTPKITATCKRDANGQAEPNKYVVSIAADCPTGLYEARVMTRLGLSASRVFSVGLLPEVMPSKPNTSLANAMELKINSVCNATMTTRAVDYYTFEARKGQRIIANCSARGIDSKLEAVLIIANAKGNDLMAERRGGDLDFDVPEDGKYVIKVHELTFGGGPAYFYRLALYEASQAAPVTAFPSTKSVSSMSWPPFGLPDQAAIAEVEPNNEGSAAQKISLPCDIAGQFFPAADVDVFEFEAKKGEVWWVEVASERLGHPTDPAVVVQRVSGTGDAQKLTDVAEFSDIASPLRVSSNGYTYDGPPYNVGSTDVLGKINIQEDGVHRLQLTDLFGGTRNDPRNRYRLVIRQSQPDFALAGWGLHFELRNGDRNAVSKPIALRRGGTVALEVLAVRRDGFDGEIELEMTGLPEGVTAQGLKIPAGKSRGMMLVTAHENAPSSVTSAQFIGKATIDGKPISRSCQLASMAWPILDAWNDIPSPRLLMDVPISVGGIEATPVSIRAEKTDGYEVTAADKLTIPLILTKHSEFSGDTLSLKALGAGFEGMKSFNVSLSADKAEAVLDLAALKVQPGDYVIAFYGSAVAKHRHRMDNLAVAESRVRKLEEEQKTIDAEVAQLAEVAKNAPPERKTEAEAAAAAAVTKQKSAQATLALASEQLKKANDIAKPNDIVDIVVSEPITIRVKPMEKK